APGDEAPQVSVTPPAASKTASTFSIQSPQLNLVRRSTPPASVTTASTSIEPGSVVTRSKSWPTVAERCVYDALTWGYIVISHAASAGTAMRSSSGGGAKGQPSAGARSAQSSR